MGDENEHLTPKKTTKITSHNQPKRWSLQMKRKQENTLLGAHRTGWLPLIPMKTLVTNLHLQGQLGNGKRTLYKY